jgi:CRISPR-associated protein Csm4
MENRIYIYNINPHSPMHTGIEGIGQERLDSFFRSDALYAALVQCWQLLYDDDWDFLLQDGPFCVSSCFPVLDQKLFYPLPVGSLDMVIRDIKGRDLKKWKRVRYVSESIFQQIIEGSLSTDRCIPKEQFLFESGTLPGSGPVEIEVPRIRIDPFSSAVSKGAFFYCVDRHFSPDDGLFFLSTFKDEKIMAKFESALMLLGDSGMGGDRSTGKGAFSFKRQEFTMRIPESGDGHVCLSLYHPTATEIDKGLIDSAYYNLIRRHGFIAGFGARSLRRKSVLMFEEGSVFFSEAPPDGDSPLVLGKGEGGCPFNVFRYGKAFSLPVKGGCFE